MRPSWDEGEMNAAALDHAQTSTMKLKVAALGRACPRWGVARRRSSRR